MKFLRSLWALSNNAMMDVTQIVLPGTDSSSFMGPSSTPQTRNNIIYLQDYGCRSKRAMHSNGATIEASQE